jgi:hypothetical protein
MIVIWWAEACKRIRQCQLYFRMELAGLVSAFTALLVRLVRHWTVITSMGVQLCGCLLLQRVSEHGWNQGTVGCDSEKDSGGDGPWTCIYLQRKQGAQAGVVWMRIHGLVWQNGIILMRHDRALLMKIEFWVKDASKKAAIDLILCCALSIRMRMRMRGARHSGHEWTDACPTEDTWGQRNHAPCVH